MVENLHWRWRDDESLHSSEGNKHQGNTKYPPITAVTRDSGGNQIVLIEQVNFEKIKKHFYP